MPLLNQLTALGVTATLLPPNARDYTLLHLYVPFGALLVFLTREVAEGKATFSKASMFALAVIYALLFAPLTFLRVYAADGKLLLLLALLFVVARSPMHSVYFDDAGRDAANAPREGQNTEALSH
jgi:drug/metabolite transporter superfamily protein YnfA